MPAKMKALAFLGKNTIKYSEVPIPSIKDDEVLMQIKSVGICGTDLHIYRGGLAVKPGTVLGHEFSGVVAKMGKNVRNVQVGDRVVGEHVITCKKCIYCKTGKPNLCSDRAIIGVHRSGALAEYLAIPADLVYPFPSEVSFEEAALVEPLSIAVYAVREAGYLLGKRVGVVGQGPVGLLVDQVLSAAGSLVTGMDVRENTLAFAKSKGWAHHLINTKTEDITERLKDIGSADGFDVTFEVVGIEATAEMSFAITRRAGQVFLLGVFSSPAKINLMNIVQKELRVQGSWTCFNAFPESIDLVVRKRVDLKSLITHRYSAKDGEKAFREAESYADNRIKSVVNFF